MAGVRPFEGLNITMIPTSDIFDTHADTARTFGSPLRDFGGHIRFAGTAVTVKCFEDNSVVKRLAATPGLGRIMVVDGGSSLRCALMGDMIAKDAAANGWAGAIIFGAVRDVAELRAITIGIKALGTTPRKSVRRGIGNEGIDLHLDSVVVRDGDQLFCDEDGVVILPANSAAE